MAFCASIGFRRFRTAYPAMPPRIRFLFVRPAICLGLPSDSQSPAKPLPLASTSPCRVCGGLPPLSERALPGAPKKNRQLAVYAFFWRYALSCASIEAEIIAPPQRRSPMQIGTGLPLAVVFLALPKA